MKTKTLLIATATLLFTLSMTSQAAPSDRMDGKRKQRPDFSTLDLNADGDIDFDEFSQHELPRGDHQTLFDILDADSNAVISEQEYTDHKPPRHKNGKGGRHEQ